MPFFLGVSLSSLGTNRPSNKSEIFLRALHLSKIIAKGRITTIYNLTIIFILCKPPFFIASFFYKNLIKKYINNVTDIKI